jgi:hypothetical protein
MMPMSRHIPEAHLALFITGDLGMWKYVQINLHIAGCEVCRARIEAYRMSRQRLKQAAAELPEGTDWDRLAAEMTANIRVGLAAGECVARVSNSPWKAVGRKASGWKTAGWTTSGWKNMAAWSAIAAGVALVLSAAWALNLPASDGDTLARVMHSLFQGGAQGRSGAARSSSSVEDRGPVVEASAEGVELRRNGIAVSIPQAASRPVAITVSAPGSASARYVDDDTGQMTISSVYVQ